MLFFQVIFLSDVLPRLIRHTDKLMKAANKVSIFPKDKIKRHSTGDGPDNQVSNMQFRFISESFGAPAHSCEG